MKNAYPLITTIIGIVVFFGVAIATSNNLQNIPLNIPVLVMGSFPVLVSIGCLMGILISDKLSILRILFIVGMLFSLILGA
jgi:hypothetical protein